MGHNDWLGVGHVLLLELQTESDPEGPHGLRGEEERFPTKTMKGIDDRQAETIDVLCSLARAAIAKYYKVDDLHNKNLLSHFWRLKVQNQGLNTGGFF